MQYFLRLKVLCYFKGIGLKEKDHAFLEFINQIIPKMHNIIWY